jgi:hypothetical protein
MAALQFHAIPLPLPVGMRGHDYAEACYGILVVRSASYSDID